MQKFKISLIIPVLNEADNITKTLSNLPDNIDLEIIVVDGGSQDETARIAKALGVQVLFSPRGRAIQMNAGATIATGDILLFLHGDTILPAGFNKLVDLALQKPGVVGGAFELKINAKIWGIGLVEKMVNWRSRFLSLPYGDQAIFVKAEIFKQLGGFPELPIMEDFVFIRRLRSKGKIETLPAKVMTSGRRWEKLGIVRTTLINQMMIIGYFLGISPEKLAHFYRKKRQ